MQATQLMVNTGQTLADFGLAEADIAAAARTSMPGEPVKRAQQSCVAIAKIGQHRS